MTFTLLIYQINALTGWVRVILFLVLIIRWPILAVSSSVEKDLLIPRRRVHIAQTGVQFICIRLDRGSAWVSKCCNSGWMPISLNGSTTLPSLNDLLLDSFSSLFICIGFNLYIGFKHLDSRDLRIRVL